MRNVVLRNPGRRRFLRDMPVAAAAGLTLADASLFTVSAAAQAGPAGAPGFKVFSAQEIQDDLKALEASPGSKSLFGSKTFTLGLTTEAAKISPEFEWHEGRDHIFHIIEGSTTFALGGSPRARMAMGRASGSRPNLRGQRRSPSIKATSSSFPAALRTNAARPEP